MSNSKFVELSSKVLTGNEKDASLNFKVSPKFKKEFKGFAVAQGISMTDLLKEGFELARKMRQKDEPVGKVMNQDQLSPAQGDPNGA